MGRARRQGFAVATVLLVAIGSVAYAGLTIEPAEVDVTCTWSAGGSGFKTFTLRATAGETIVIDFDAITASPASPTDPRTCAGYFMSWPTGGIGSAGFPGSVIVAGGPTTPATCTYRVPWTTISNPFESGELEVVVKAPNCAIVAPTSDPNPVVLDCLPASALDTGATVARIGNPNPIGLTLDATWVPSTCPYELDNVLLTLGPGGQKDLTIRADPYGPASDVASCDLQLTGDGVSLTVPVSTVDCAPPPLLTLPSIDVGNVLVGQGPSIASGDATGPFLRGWTASLHASGDGFGFPACSGAATCALPIPGPEAAIAIEATPSALGPMVGTLTIEGGASVGSLLAFGAGLEPAALDFGVLDTQPGATRVAEPVRVRAAGTLTAARVTGPFTLSVGACVDVTTCTTDLIADQVELGVRCAPTMGTSTGTLEVDVVAAGRSVTLSTALSCGGAPSSVLAAGFAGQALLCPDDVTPLTRTLTSTSTQPLEIWRPTLDGGAASPFALTVNPDPGAGSLLLAEGAQVDATLTLSSTAPGTYTDTFRWRHAAGLEVVPLAITIDPALTVAPLALPLGTPAVGVQVAGNVEVRSCDQGWSLVEVRPADDRVVVLSPEALPAALPRTVTLSFTPADVVPVDAEVELVVADAAGARRTVSVQVTAAPQGATPTVDSTSYYACTCQGSAGGWADVGGLVPLALVGLALRRRRRR